jgi:hypothetical protein
MAFVNLTKKRFKDGFSISFFGILKKLISEKEYESQH